MFDWLRRPIDPPTFGGALYASRPTQALIYGIGFGLADLMIRHGKIPNEPAMIGLASITELVFFAACVLLTGFGIMEIAHLVRTDEL